jgi:D-alanyl-D-alanine carboxypeptidase/D-alanyl-D-alanine-endopeptidase (penicillin-binding protein 4)
VRALIQRVAIPVVLLAAIIGAGVAVDRFGHDPLPEATTAVDNQSALTPLFSIRRAPEMLTSQRANDELTASLDQWVATLPPNSCFVVSAGAELIYEHQAQLPLSPASNMQVLTATAALQALGTDYTFDTRVAALQLPDENGLLAGDLYIIGSGDPLLMTDAYAATLPPAFSAVRSSANALAEQTVATNLSDISGAVVVDESRYDNERAPAETPQAVLDAGLLGSLGATIMDRGFLGFSDGYASQQVTEGEPPPLARSTDPGAEFAANFDDLLERINVRISSRSRVLTDALTEQLVDLLIFRSPPLSAIVAQMLTNSDNTTAEMLVKELGAVVSDSGSTTAGTLALSNLLRDAGLADQGLFALDGSGLNPGTTATCTLLHDALNSVHKDTLRAALPVAGETGTLVDDFIGTKGEGRISAKNGLQDQASALSGYFVTDPGVELTFSLIINVGEGETITAEQVTGWQRPLPRLLASYPSGPALDDLGPLGPEPEAG